MGAGEEASALEALPNRPGVSDFRRALKKDLKNLKSVQNLVIALDEIEYICPPSQVDVESENGAEVVQLMGSLRSLVQETSNFSFLIAGITPDIFRRGMLFGRHNPLFSWVVQDTCDHSQKQRRQTCFRRLGTPNGSPVGDERDWSSSVTGWRPRIHVTQPRGSRSRSIRRQLTESRRVTDEIVRKCIPEWIQQVRPNIDEQVAHVARYYQLEARMLEQIVERGREQTAVSDRLRRSYASTISLTLGSSCTNTATNRDKQESVRAVDYLLR